jgi:hypothetical protein
MIKLNKNKNLVISTVSDSSLHKSWCNSKAFDTYLIYFGDNKGFKGETKYYKKAKGYKYHLIKDALDEDEFWKNYEYIWLPDDDLMASSEDVERLFQLMKTYDLELAQPSIMGYYGTWITLHQMGSIVRFTNWVEIMCPCFSKSALSVCKETFKENNCGWGIEGTWNVLLGHPQNKIGIIDDVVVTHTRPVLSGDTYTGKSNALKFAQDEGDQVFKKWKLGQELKKDLLTGTPLDSEVFGAVQYSQIKKHIEKNIDRKDRVWPNKNIIKNIWT